MPDYDNQANSAKGLMPSRRPPDDGPIYSAEQERRMRLGGIESSGAGSSERTALQAIIGDLKLHRSDLAQIAGRISSAADRALGMEPPKTSQPEGNKVPQSALMEIGELVDSIQATTRYIQEQCARIERVA